MSRLLLGHSQYFFVIPQRSEGICFLSAPLPSDRSFKLLPGFECIPLAIPIRPNTPIHIRIEPK